MPKQNQKENAAANNPFPKMEEEVLAFWDKAEIFKKSIERPAGLAAIIPQAPFFDQGGNNPPSPLYQGGNGNYVFYDGPPFGTGEPHYGHILSSIAKDVVPRFWTMQGYRVERRWGWDCHGLPIENIIEKDLGGDCSDFKPGTLLLILPDINKNNVCPALVCFFKFCHDRCHHFAGDTFFCPQVYHCDFAFFRKFGKILCKNNGRKDQH